MKDETDWVYQILVIWPYWTGFILFISALVTFWSLTLVATPVWYVRASKAHWAWKTLIISLGEVLMLPFAIYSVATLVTEPYSERGIAYWGLGHCMIFALAVVAIAKAIELLQKFCKDPTR